MKQSWIKSLDQTVLYIVLYICAYLKLTLGLETPFIYCTYFKWDRVN